MKKPMLTKHQFQQLISAIARGLSACYIIDCRKLKLVSMELTPMQVGG